MTGAPANAWVATAAAGQYPAAPGACATAQRRNAAVSPTGGSTDSLTAGTRPRLSPYNSPAVIGRPPLSTAANEGTIAETATAAASGWASRFSAVSGPCRHA